MKFFVASGGAFGFLLGFLISDELTLFYLGASIFIPCVIISLIAADERKTLISAQPIESPTSVEIPPRAEDLATTPRVIEETTSKLGENTMPKKEPVCSKIHKFRYAFWLLVVNQLFAW